MKHPGGRRPTPEKDRLSYWIKFRVTPGEAEALFSRARASKRSLSRMLRDLVAQKLVGD